MAKRKYTSKKSRKTYKKKSYKSKQIVHKFTRTFNFVNGTVSNTSQTNYNPAYTTSVGGVQVTRFTFALNDVANASDFLQLYRWFRITNIRMKIMNVAENNAIEAVEGTELNANRYHVCLVTDGNWPTSKAEMQQCSGYRSYYASQSTTINISPIVLNSVYQSSTLTGYTALRSPWLSTSYASVPHYGLVVLTENMTSLGSVHYCEAKCSFEFKGVR